MLNRFIISLAAWALACPVFALNIGDYRLVDLSHSYNSDTLYWPTSPSRFEKKQLVFGTIEGLGFYAAFSVCTPEHGGTHLDAPLHFSETGMATEQVPLERLMAPGIVIDISEQAGADRNYRLSVRDVLEFETQHGPIPPGTVVLLRTGWSQYWPNAKAYLGDDTPGDASKLQFPSYGEEAAKLLVEQRQVVLLGVDTASIDYGRSQDLPVHRAVAAQNVSGLENLTALEQLPATGFVIIALPMKIEGGSGGPARVVALIPE